MNPSQGELWDGISLSKTDVLRGISFGERIAEDEVENLESYFVETDLWRRTLSGEVDVVLGGKGAGKSAIYSLLLRKNAELRTRGVLAVACENPRGAAAFKDLVVDPPTSEPEFQALWKLYFLAVLGNMLRAERLLGASGKSLVSVLESEHLLEPEASLGKLLRNAQDYVRGIFRPAAVEGSVQVDPLTGMPKGFVGKISFREPSVAQREAGVHSADSLLRLANQALEEGGKTAWLLLDRLDVAFEESPALEKNALRALFRVYRDLGAIDHVVLKIFLRTDIMRRIAEEGFREASHITRLETIQWGDKSLFNLLIRRLIRNESVTRLYGIKEAVVLESATEQRLLFDRVFPDQVEPGEKRRKTFSWMLSRCCDGSKETAPRELIHLLSSARKEQLRTRELGHSEPSGEALFDGAALKDAMPEVSKIRLETVILSEHPELSKYVHMLEGEKTQQSPESLVRVWGLERAEALRLAGDFVRVGIFEQRGTKDAPEFWVPFLYRDALKLVRGSAAAEDDD